MSDQKIINPDYVQKDQYNSDIDNIKQMFIDTKEDIKEIKDMIKQDRIERRENENKLFDEQKKQSEVLAENNTKTNNVENGLFEHKNNHWKSSTAIISIVAVIVMIGGIALTFFK